MQPDWPYDQVQPVPVIRPVDGADATIPPHLAPRPGRSPARRRQWPTSLVACIAVVIALAALAVTLVRQAAMQDQISQLRHQVATTQAQLSSAADKGGTQMAGLSKRLDSLSGTLNNLVLQVGPDRQVCQTDLTGPDGPAVFSFPCKQARDG
jgi:hypothetical protein